MTKQVRNAIKEYQKAKQDMQLDLSETFKPIVKAQEETKQTIDEKQDKILNQLQKTQKAITSGLENMIMLQHLPDTQPQETTKLPIDYKPAMMMEPQFKSDLDAGFDIDEIQKLTEYGLYRPSEVLKASMKDDFDIDSYDKNISKLLNKLGSKKGNLSKSSKSKTKNKNEIDELTKDIKLIQKCVLLGAIPFSE